ncbi:hypothetical protein BMS3Abin02_00362 [bacterium BMS3Abin02]|nr:hypothetical protein BMS3Abin02_00362 [bacterium BMS3Abin02]
MTIALQGTWTVSVKSKSAAWQQRFKIEGSTNGVDGTYAGDVATAPVQVTGSQWGVSIENNPTGPISWRPSRMRFTSFRVNGSLFQVDIQSDDGGGGDEDFNDLVLTASMGITDSEYIVYGAAKSYSGLCLVNPCFPRPWIVIDTFAQFERVVRYPEIAAALERAYPGRTEAILQRRDRFTPVVLALGGVSRDGLAVSGSAEIELVTKGRSKKQTIAVEDKNVKAATVASRWGTMLEASDISALGKLRARFSCDVDPIGNALLRFEEYDRTSEELAGGPYEGFGNRESLGVTGTDEFGNYLFRFARSTAQVIEESQIDVAPGESAVTQARPDVIIQFVEEPEGVATHETAPYYNIGNIRRIDLCIPAGKLLPKPCRGDRVLQYLGDIPIINNPHSNLKFDGTITNTSASESGPAVENAAWRGTVNFYGCFEDTQPEVHCYTMEVWESGGWRSLSVAARGLRQQGTGVWTLESYGPEDAGDCFPNTGPVDDDVPVYRNIEREAGWSLGVQHLKARLNVADYLPAGLERRVGKVWFRIRGYDVSRQVVPGATDVVGLYVDMEPAVGDIASVSLPGQGDLGDCTMVNLPTAGAALNVRLRATDADGFLAAWSLRAIRGSNVAIGLTGDVSDAYPGDDPNSARFHGTTEIASSDLDGYVDIPVTPTAGQWIPDGYQFCAFSFELILRDNTTDGVTAASSRKVWDEVLGMSFSASPSA